MTGGLQRLYLLSSDPASCLESIEEDPAHSNTHTSSTKPGAPKSNCNTPAIPSIDDSEQKKKRRRRSAGDSLTTIPSPPGGALGSYLQDSGSTGTCPLGGLKRQRALQALRANVHFALSCSVSDDKDKDNLTTEADVGKNKRQGCLLAVCKALQQYAGNHPLGRIDSNAESENSEVKEKMKPKPKVKKEKDFMGFMGDCPIAPGTLLTPTMLGSGAGGQVGGMSVVSCPPPISTSLPYLLLSPPVTGNMMYSIPGSTPVSTQGPLNIPTHEDPPVPSFRPVPPVQYSSQHVSTPFHPTHSLQSLNVAHHMNLVNNTNNNINNMNNMNNNINNTVNNNINNTVNDNGDDDSFTGYSVSKSNYSVNKDHAYSLTHSHPIRSSPVAINHGTDINLTSNNNNSNNNSNSNNKSYSNNNNNIGNNSSNNNYSNNNYSNNNNNIGNNSSNNNNSNNNQVPTTTNMRNNSNAINKTTNDTDNTNNNSFTASKYNANTINTTTNTNLNNTNNNNSNSNTNNNNNANNNNNNANNNNNNANDSNNNDSSNNANNNPNDDKDGLLALEGLLSLSKY